MEKSALIIFLIFVFAQIQGDEKSYNFDLYTLDDVLYSTNQAEYCFKAKNTLNSLRKQKKP
ncbi:MAG TPA: hypothetical protein PLW37_00830 [bacterium]|nr:hypothetical protein [bacterium]HQB08386.1 hypothetical protein [bacterium]HRQ71260.1 hypothetical protein [bacterium]